MVMLLPDAFSRPVRLQPLRGSAWAARGIRVLVKREDERDPLLGGNKWCKLVGHLAVAQERGLSRLLSVGGAWSNHLHALAHAGQRHGFETVGIVRGDDGQMTAMLEEAVLAGMQLEFVSRESYRQRHEAGWQEHLTRKFGPCLHIPEGGAGAPARRGLAILAAELVAQTSGPVILALPVGSGTTLMGLRAALPSRFTVWGFQAFADAGLSVRLQHDLATTDPASWRLFSTQAMRAHRELPSGLSDFLKAFEGSEGIVLDPVYTVRMLARLQSLIVDATVPDGSTVIVLHTGGLQGRRGHLLEQAA